MPCENVSASVHSFRAAISSAVARVSGRTRTIVFWSELMTHTEYRRLLASQSHLLASDSSLSVDASVTRLLASSSMPTDKGNIFLRVAPKVKARWMKMCDARGLKQQTAGARIVEWIVKQDKAVQQAILNGGKTETVRSGGHVTVIVDAEDGEPSGASRVGEPPESPAQSPESEKCGKP